jgi:hypothetical protein
MNNANMDYIAREEIYATILYCKNKQIKPLPFSAAPGGEDCKF